MEQKTDSKEIPKLQVLIFARNESDEERARLTLDKHIPEEKRDLRIVRSRNKFIGLLNKVKYDVVFAHFRDPPNVLTGSEYFCIGSGNLRYDFDMGTRLTNLVDERYPITV